MPRSVKVTDLRKGDVYRFGSPDGVLKFEVLSTPDEFGTFERRIIGGVLSTDDVRKVSYTPDTTVVVVESNPSLAPGTRFTYLGPEADDVNYYVVNEDGGVDHVTYGTTYRNVGTVEGYYNEAARIIDTTTNVQEDDNTVNNNGVKLELAADYGLQAKFNYTNLSLETHDVRLKVEDYDGEYVEGESYDEFGRSEGYKRYILDRINDSVVIR